MSLKQHPGGPRSFFFGKYSLVPNELIMSAPDANIMFHLFSGFEDSLYLLANPTVFFFVHDYYMCGGLLG